MERKLRVLVTCPPMLNVIEEFLPLFHQHGIEVTIPRIVQTLSEAELQSLLPSHDGWIIGDDPATRDVFVAGKGGRLRAAVKWGVGVDNVDFAACAELGIPIENTPRVFGAEVADVALGYVIALARDIFYVDRRVRMGEWAKPRGISLAGRTCAVLGYGDIGRSFASRAIALGITPLIYDPGVSESAVAPPAKLQQWFSGIATADFVVVTCALTDSSRRMINRDSLAEMKTGVRIVNVARGAIIDEEALIEALRAQHVYSAALDVFEIEPLPLDSPLRQFDRCILGAHNASNTTDAVRRTSEFAISKLLAFLART